MASLMQVEHGSCPCGGRFENREVEVSMTAPRLMLLRDVPQGVCPKCGSRVFKLQVLELVEELMKENQILGRTQPPSKSG